VKLSQASIVVVILSHWIFLSVLTFKPQGFFSYFNRVSGLHQPSWNLFSSITLNRYIGIGVRLNGQILYKTWPGENGFEKVKFGEQSSREYRMAENVTDDLYFQFLLLDAWAVSRPGSEKIKNGKLELVEYRRGAKPVEQIISERELEPAP
jgi:hypothetical protein